MPPEEQPNALNEERGGDDVMNMIREGLDERDRVSAERTRRPEDETPQEKPAETPAETPRPSGEPPEEQPTPEPETDLNALLEATRQENLRLKKRLGDQGNQVGSLRDRLAELGEILDRKATGEPEAPEDPIQRRYAVLSEKYGEDFAKEIIETGLALTADLRSKTLLTGFREEMPDFKDHETDMAEILKEDPELRAAVTERPRLLRVVYQAAKGRKAARVVGEAEQRGTALATKIAAEKRAATAERPGGSQNKEPRQATKQEIGNSILDRIQAARQDGRHR